MKEFVFPQKIALIIAHPDDETEIAAGLLYNNSKLGGENHLFCATKGERGKAYLEEDLSDRELADLRAKELYSVGEFLGIGDIKVSDFRDGFLYEEETNLASEVKDFILKVKPDAVLSFGDDGYTGHRDHTVLGKIARKISLELGFKFIEFSTPHIDTCPGFYDYLSSKRKNGFYEDNIEKNKANLFVKIDKDTKLQALKLYKTQFKGLDPYNTFPKDIADHLLEYEYFYQMENN